MNMRELFVAREHMTDGTGGPLCLDYYVLVEEARIGDAFCCENYGVRVAHSGGGETAAVSNITTSARRIDELMELLVRGRVTPSTLWDVVEDWLAAGSACQKPS